MHRIKNQITICAGILIILAMCIIGIPAAGASPQLPCEFFGTVTISGSPAPAGTEIAAYVNNVKQGTIKVKEAGVYGGVGTFDERLIVLSGENDFSDGAPMIVFKIGDKVADQSTQYTPGTSTELALTTGGTPVVVTPAPATEQPVTAMQAETVAAPPAPVTPLITPAPASGDVQAMAVQTMVNQTMQPSPVIPIPTAAPSVPVQTVSVPVVPVATAAPAAQSSIPVVLPTQPVPVQTAIPTVVPVVTAAQVPQATASMMSTPTPVTGITGSLPGNQTPLSVVPNQTITPVVTPVIPVVPAMTTVPSPTSVPVINGTPQAVIPTNQTSAVQTNVTNSTQNQTPAPATVSVSFPSGQTITQ